MERVVYIYALSFPTNPFKVYIGQSVNVIQRIALHKRDKKNTKKTAWLRKHLALGEELLVSVIDQAPASYANALEVEWIKKYRDDPRYEVTNMADGGYGIRGHKHSEEVKRRIGLARKGKRVSEATIQRYARRYLITKPDGSKEEILNLKKYCRENGLQPSNMLGVAGGRERSHKGYQCQRL